MMLFWWYAFDCYDPGNRSSFKKKDKWALWRLGRLGAKNDLERSDVTR